MLLFNIGGDQLLAIRKCSPMLYDFFKEANTDDLEWIKPILKLILNKLQYIQSHSPHSLPKTKATSDSYKSSGDFPALPRVVNRGSYHADRNTTSTSVDACTKLGKRKNNLLPGIFLMYCSHGEFLSDC